MSNRIYFFEDFSAKDLDESLVGRKGMSLFQLKDADVPVPPFFATSPLVFDDLIFKAFGDKVEEYVKKTSLPDPIDVEKLLMDSDFSTDVEEEIFKAYAKLSGFSDAWVAVRSSVIYPLNGRVLFSGVFATEVNVRGFEELVIAIKKIYASVFQDSVLSYAKKHEIDLSQLRMAVVVQKMVQAEVSGVTYTKELITQDETKMSIEAVFGLGVVIANGEITPDRYVLNKKDISFEEKRVSPQEWMSIRILNTKGKGGVERVNISSSWSHQQKLEDRFLKEIAKVCLLIEDSFGKAQNIEWVWESGKVWIIQNKMVYTPQRPKLVDENYSNVLLNPVLDVVRKRKEEEILMQSQEKVCEDKSCEKEKKESLEKEMSELDKKIEKLSGKFEELARKKIAQEQKKIDKMTEGIQKEKEGIVENVSKSLLQDSLKTKEFKFLASGVGVSAGNKVGQIIHVNAKNFKDLIISKENILVLKEIFPGVENAVYLSGGVLMDLGGVSSDISVLCREFSIPAIFDIKNIGKIVKDGDFVKIDANAGSLYKYSEEMEELDYEVVQDVGKNEKEVVKEKIVSKIKEDVAVYTEFPKTATEVFLSSCDVEDVVLKNANGLGFLDVEKLMLNEGRHPLAFAQEGKLVDYTNLIAKKLDAVADKFAGNEVIVSLGSFRSKDFACLTKGKNFEKGDRSRGVIRYLQNPDFAKVALKSVQKSRNLYKNKNISLAFHSPLSQENMIAIKKKVLSFGLRRSSSFKIYSILENPSEVLLVDDIVASNIDGLIINTPALAKQLQGLSLYDDKALYSLETNSLFKVLDTICEKAKDGKTKIVGVCEKNEKLIKKYVELGVCAVIVDSEFFEKAKSIISEKETEIILSKT